MQTTTISGVTDAALPLTGEERVIMDQGPISVDASTQDIANLVTRQSLGLGVSSSPIFVGATLSGIAASRLVFTGAGGALTGVPLGAGLSIVDGALTAAGGGYPSLAVPTGFGVTGSGTASIAIAFATGYSLPTTASQSSWNAAALLAETAVQPDDLALYLSEAEAAATYVAQGAPVPTLVAVRNNSGATLTIGTPVYINDSSGTRPTVVAADASAELTAARTLGLMYATAANNTDGIAITHGILPGVSTSPLTQGGIVWLSEAAGQLTSTRPTQPAHGVFMGFCIKQGAGASGILYVNVINGQELEELHDVLISGATAGQFLRLADDGLWKNETFLASAISDSSTVGRALLTAASAATQRTALGLGSAAQLTAGTAAGNVPVLDGSGLVPSALLPGFVDDVLEFASVAAFPSTGEAGKLYVSLATNRQYRWAGSIYVEINPSPGSTDAVPEGSVNLYFTTARGQSAAASWWSGYRSTVGDQLVTAASQSAARTAIGAGTSDLVISSAAAQALGATASAGTSADAARADHVHPRSTYADLGAIADGIVFTISNRGETATASTNYDESLPLSFAVTVTRITFITHIDNTGSSTTTLSAYKRTAAGTKTSLLSANATLTPGASVATGSLSGTAGVLSLAAGDRLGVDLIGLGTGASGIKCIIEYTRSAVSA